ncbi:ketopantoate reductase family protein [Mangrovicoccus sp. HB161399]|uniref:ketopantoate reductase family protein n=1 Tax=Mangrovicoccus sp. HB161399 TaxID=2720392 RepID=UPI0015571EA9|nr:2-dehydropantoate 2-reductase [Mangrovicoccus sp. HB161399]
MSAPVLIWGAGAIGGILGAYLARAGHDVLLVDADAEHVAAMNRDGLAVEGPVDAFAVPVRAALPDEVEGHFDLAFLCVKGPQTEAAAGQLARVLSTDGAVVSAQNGLFEPWLERIFGQGRVIGCFVNYSGDYIAPGRLLFGNRGKIAVGELDGKMTARLARVRDLFAVLDPESEASPRVMDYLWGKMGYGAMLFATALTPASMSDNFAHPDFRGVFAGVAREVMQVAVAAGADPLGFNGYDPAAYMPGAAPEAAEASLDALVAFNRATAKTHSGIWRDIAVRKRRTEVDFQVGAVVAEAERLGVDVPLCRALAALIRELEAGRPQGWDVLEELAGYLPAPSRSAMM